MSRLLLVIAGAAVSVAIAATAYVVVKQNSRWENAPPAVSVDARDGQEAGSQAHAVPLPTSQAEAPAKPVDLAEPEASGGQPAEVDPSADTAAMTTGVDLEALVNNLTPEQEKKLYGIVRKRDRGRRTVEAKYWLPSDRYLRSANLKLSEEQQKQIEAIKNGLKPSMDLALAGLRAQLDDWGRRQRELWGNAKTMEGQRQPEFMEQVQTMSREYAETREQMNQIQEPFDQEYMAQVHEVLTPEQMATLEDSIAEQKKRQGQWNTQWTGGGFGGASPGPGR